MVTPTETATATGSAMQIHCDSFDSSYGKIYGLLLGDGCSYGNGYGFDFVFGYGDGDGYGNRNGYGHGCGEHGHFDGGNDI